MDTRLPCAGRRQCRICYQRGSAHCLDSPFYTCSRTLPPLLEPYHVCQKTAAATAAAIAAAGAPLLYVRAVGPLDAGTLTAVTTVWLRAAITGATVSTCGSIGAGGDACAAWL